MEVDPSQNGRPACLLLPSPPQDTTRSSQLRLGDLWLLRRKPAPPAPHPLPPQCHKASHPSSRGGRCISQPTGSHQSCSRCRPRPWRYRREVAGGPAPLFSHGADSQLGREEAFEGRRRNPGQGGKGERNPAERGSSKQVIGAGSHQ